MMGCSATRCARPWPASVTRATCPLARSETSSARLRSALRSYALLGGDPAEVLGRPDHQVQHFDRR
jgi:hypothetical protein